MPNNYPSSDTDGCDQTPAQVYRPDDWEYGLRTNSQLLGAQVGLSRVLSDGLAGLGLFARRRFEEEEVVGFLWGKFVTLDQWEAIVERSGARAHQG